MTWLAKAQASLLKEGIKAWLIYDFRGSNPIAREVLKLAKPFSHPMFCLVPQKGKALLLVQHSEQLDISDPTLHVRSYSSRQHLQSILAELLPKARVALEYWANAEIPAISFVDAGTVEMLRSLGMDLVSSAAILQNLSTWDKDQLAAHKKAASHLAQAKNIAFEYISLHAAIRSTIRESEVQRVISDYFDRHKLSYCQPPGVSFAGNSSRPGYSPKAGADALLKNGDVIRIDISAKLAIANAPYAHITWMAVYGTGSGHVQRVWEVLKEARNMTVQNLENAYKEKLYPQAQSLDTLSRDFIEQKGYKHGLLHRTGYSLGVDSVCANAAHLDSFESNDSRPLSPGIGIAVSPGIYLDHFGMRTGINLYLDSSSPQITTEVQEELVLL